LLARRQGAAQQYRWRLPLRRSTSKNCPQLKHLRCPDCAIAAPQWGQQRQPNRLRPRPPGMSLKKTDQARRKRVKDADQKKTNGEEDARSLRPTKKTFGLPLTAWTWCFNELNP
jgi:hypothetical protein